MLGVIENVLQRYAELQTNLSSEAARRQVATAIVAAIDAHFSDTDDLTGLVALPPFDVSAADD